MEKPEITAEIARRRVRAGRGRLEVDALISACPWAERPLSVRRPVLEVMDLFELLAQSGGDRDHERIAARSTILGPGRAARDRRRRRPGAGRAAPRAPSARACPRRSRSTAGCEHMPQGRGAAEDRRRRSREVVKLANRLGIPVVPRAGGTGLSDGAVPMRGAAASSSTCKLMNQIHEIDLVDRTVTVGPGINMLKLNEVLRPHGVFYPDDPASYPCSLVGGRIGTGGWSLLGARFGHTRDLVISMEVVLPTGEIVEIAEGGGRKLRKSSTGLTLKHLFTGHQGTLGHLHRGDARAGPAAGDRVRRLLRVRRLHEGVARPPGALTKSGLATIAGVVLFDEWKLRYLRRDDEAYIPQPEDVQAVDRRRHVRAPGRGRAGVEGRSCELGRADGGKYLGDEISQGDWASRHDRYATPLHGRTLRTARSCRCPGTARTRRSTTPCSRRCARSGTRSSTATSSEYGIFDDWGMFAYTSGALQAVGATTWWRSTSGSGSRSSTTTNWDGLGALQARDLRGHAQVRRLDDGLPRRHPRGRRRARADRDGQRVGGGQGASSARSTPTT